MADLFNHKAVQAKRQRARNIARQGADFLLGLAVEDICDRLDATNRDFQTIVELFPLTNPSPLEKGLAANATSYQRINHLEELAGLEDNSIDLVVSALSLHWMENLPLVFAQVLRVLKPDGLFLAAVPGEDTLSELRETLFEVELSQSGGASPRVDPFPTLNALGSLLQGAGFALPVVDLERFTVRYANFAALIGDLRAMAATSSLNANNRPASRSIFAGAGKIYQQKFCDDDGRIRASFTIAHLSGWKPHESQQKPLKPGSAQAALKDFL